MKEKRDMSKTQMTTGRCRLSYVSVFEPKLMPDGITEKYTVTLLIPKQDKKTLAKIAAAQKAAKEAFMAKKPGKKLSPNMPTTLHDGDGLKENGEEFGAECKGCMVMTVASKTKPVIVYGDKTPMTEPTEMYSGCYGRAVINFFVYDTAGKVGITAGLNGIMKLEDGEPLAGGIVTDSDWDDDYDDYSDIDGMLD